MKKVLRVFSLVMIFSLLLVFTSCNNSVISEDEVKEKMETLGYVALDASQFVVEENDMKNAFYFAKGTDEMNALASIAKGGDYIVILYFNDVSKAKSVYQEYKNSLNENVSIERVNECVYFGTEAAIKDFK